MRILLFLSDLMIPLLFFYIIGFGLLMKKDIYNDFVTGAFDGLKTVVKIMPTLIGLMTGVGILRASGFLDALASLLENILKPTGFPSALVPLSIVKMFSSSAATSLLLDLYKQHGPDSTTGLTASLILSSTETIFYTLSVYYIAAKSKTPATPSPAPSGHFIRHHRQHHHSKPYVNPTHLLSYLVHHSINNYIIHFPIPTNPLRSQPLSPPRKKQRQTPGFLVCRVPFATTNFPYSRKFPAFLYLFIIPKYITNSSADAKIHATGSPDKSPDNSYNAKQPQPSALFLPALQSLPSWEGIHIPFPGYRFGIHLPH